MTYNGNPDNVYKTVIQHVKYLLWILLISAVSAALSIALNNLGIDKENTLMIFLVGVLTITTVTRGYIYGAIASVLSVMIFNYFFTQPVHTLRINNANDIILLVFFLIASLISSTMTIKFQYQTDIAKRNERTVRLLYEITKGFLNVTGTENIIYNGIKYIYEYTGYHCSVKLDSYDKIFYSPGYPMKIESDKNETYLIPIKGHANPIGTMEIINVKLPVSTENDILIKTIVSQMALVFDREFIYNEREKIRIAMESESLKSTLLRSVSHDLRSPLTGIIGASELILESFETLDTLSVKKFVSDIREESTWLIKSVQNILDMTRISEGRLTVNKEYEAVDDLINQAVTHTPQLAASGRLHVSVPMDIILILVDGRLIVQTLVNLLDNAFKHSGNDSEIFLKAYRSEGNVIFEISDNGTGIDPAISDTLFDGFVTLHKNIADGSRGVGLGLAICKAVVTAHNGSITAYNQKTGGAILKIELPIEEI